MRTGPLVVGLSLFAASAGGAQQSTADRYVGIWQGAISVNTLRLRLAFEFRRDSSGGLTGVMTSIDQGGAKVPGRVAVTGDTLVMMLGPAARYRATINAS